MRIELIMRAILRSIFFMELGGILLKNPCKVSLLPVCISMADFNVNFRHTVSPKVTQRTLLLGRVKMAQAIQLPESKWAEMLSEVERDPLFQELISADMGGQRIVRYKRYGRTSLSGQFYEMQDANVIDVSGPSPETLLEQKRYLITLIKKIGQDNFEKFFLYREEGKSIEAIAQGCGLTLEEATALNEFIVSMSVQAEFYHPSELNGSTLMKPTKVGKINRNEDGTYSISFFSPHLARGMYEINHAVLKRWQQSRGLDRAMAARLRKYVGLLEMSNLKQGAFWRVIEVLLDVQKAYFDTKDPALMAPVSLREVARRLQFAPSTISRVLHGKSVILPWDHEVLISALMPGQRNVVLSILDKMTVDLPAHVTDAVLAQRVADKYNVHVSRRTITACRHVLQQQHRKAA